MEGEDLVVAYFVRRFYKESQILTKAFFDKISKDTMYIKSRDIYDFLRLAKLCRDVQTEAFHNRDINLQDKFNELQEIAAPPNFKVSKDHVEISLNIADAPKIQNIIKDKLLEYAEPSDADCKEKQLALIAICIFIYKNSYPILKEQEDYLEAVKLIENDLRQNTIQVRHCDYNCLLSLLRTYVNEKREQISKI
ncbi:Hypothetical protein HVR_LOCUS875 [uncultured virus]|nr:Hypothetical protein HVR_LOCUS875 [uncultured virus]